jgi:hypothetical protein
LAGAPACQTLSVLVRLPFPVPHPVPVRPPKRGGGGESTTDHVCETKQKVISFQLFLYKEHTVPATDGHNTRSFDIGIKKVLNPTLIYPQLWGFEAMFEAQK